jgi:hypothetical protein
MKIVLFVEGHTEKKALPDLFRRWLDVRLVPRRIGIKVVRFEGWRDYYGEIAKKVHLNLSGKTGADVVGAIGLLDLYGPTFYPPHANTAAERYGWAKAEIEQRVSHPRFRQHFAVHETEAWLLSMPEHLPKDARDGLPRRLLPSPPQRFSLHHPVLAGGIQRDPHEPLGELDVGDRVVPIAQPASPQQPREGERAVHQLRADRLAEPRLVAVGPGDDGRPRDRVGQVSFAQRPFHPYAHVHVGIARRLGQRRHRQVHEPRPVPARPCSVA